MIISESKDTVTVTACPWCHDTIPVTIHIGFVNKYGGQYGKRTTTTTVRRTAAVEHACVDPTGPR